MLSRPCFLGCLLVGVGPVIDLLLDELAGIKRTEGRAGEKQVVASGDGKIALVNLVASVDVTNSGVRHLGGVALVLILLLEELFGVIVPRAKVIFVEDD